MIDYSSRKQKCSICGKQFIGWGNNPEPVEEGKCCDECNSKYVIPTRIFIAELLQGIERR